MSNLLGDYIIETRFSNPFKGNLYQNYDQWVSFIGVVETERPYFWLDVCLYLHSQREMELANQVQAMMIPKDKYPELFNKHLLPAITRTQLLETLPPEYLWAIYDSFKEMLEKCSEICDNDDVDRPPYFREWKNIFEMAQKTLILIGELK